MRFAYTAFAILFSLVSISGADPEPLDGGKDRTEELKVLVQKGLDLARTDKSKLPAFAQGFVMPDAEAWCKQVFGEEAGARVAAKYAKEVAHLPGLVAMGFEYGSRGKGDFEIEVTRVEASDRTSGLNQRAIVRAMKSKETLYAVRARTKDGADYYGTFIYANGGFRRIDSMIEAASTEDRCGLNLMQDAVYIALFESKFNRDPLDFSELRRPDMMTDPRLLQCPVHQDDPDGFAFFYPFADDSTTPETLVAWDKTTHADGRRNVLNYQGRIELMPDAEFQKLLAAQRKASIPGLKKAIEGNESWPKDAREKSPPREKRLELLKQMLTECEAVK